MTRGEWDKPVVEGQQAAPSEEGGASSSSSSTAPEEPTSSNAMRLAILGLGGIAVFLVALIGVVLLARALRPLVHAPKDAAEGTVEDWVVQLRHTTDPAKRSAAAEKLATAGPEAVARALDATATIVGQGDSLSFVVPVMRALAETGPASAPAFAQALKSEKDNVRAGAAYVLREMGPAVGTAGDAATQAEMVGALSAALADENRWVRWYAIETLANLGPTAAPAVDALAGLVEHRDAATRLRVVRALGRIGSAARHAVPALQKAHDEDRDQAVRRAAGEALLDVNLPGLAAEAAARASEQVRELIGRLQSENEFESVSAANALGRMGNDAADAAPALARSLESPHKWVRAASADALGALSTAGVDVRMVVPRLEKTARDADPDVRAAAEKALGRIKPGGPR